MGKCTLLLVFGVLFAAGCGGTFGPGAGARNTGGLKGSGAVALAVSGKIITGDEITAPLVEPLTAIAQVSDFERFKEQGRPAVERAVKEKISYLLLYQQVKKDMGEKTDLALEKGAEREVRRLVAGFGGDYDEAEEYLRKEGMDWKSFKEVHKKLILISLQMPRPRPITYSDLLAYYNEVKEEYYAVEGTITLRVIEIRPGQLEVDNPNEDRVEQARKLANNLVTRIREGEDFGLLAKEYSHGYMRGSGGLWRPRRPESLAEPYDILARRAERMKPGEVEGPIENKTGEHIFIIKLEEKQLKGFRPLAEVQRQVAQRITLDRQRRAAEELDIKLGQQVAVIDKREFIDFCLDKIYQMSNR